MESVPEKVTEAMQKFTVDGRITCEEAHALARQLDVDIIVIGRAADEMGIRIKACQLGCF